jgi:hypothetical protein
MGDRLLAWTAVGVKMLADPAIKVEVQFRAAVAS